MITKLVKISDDDLREIRAVGNKHDALQSNPTAYSAAESEQIYADYHYRVGKLFIDYHIDGTVDWRISLFTGDIWEVL